MQQDATQQPAGANKEGGLRVDARPRRLCDEMRCKAEARLHFPVFEHDFFFVKYRRVYDSSGILRILKIPAGKRKNVPVFEAEKRFRF